MKTTTDVELVRQLRPNVVFVIGWQRLIPKSIIDEVESGAIGFHGSANFLPWGRGRSPINWSIIEGRERFILHMFFITPGIDDGDIIGMEIFDLQPEETCRSAYYKVALSQARLIFQHVGAIRSCTCPRTPQSGPTFAYPKRTPEDGKIFWSDSGEDICRLVRAVTFPSGAFSNLRGSRVNIWRCQYLGDNLLTANARPGEVAFVSSNSFAEVIVQTGHGAVLLTEYESRHPIDRGDCFDA
jgi:methionyl-tRNA formyltransferase